MDERFSGLLLRHRGRTGLTQRELAARVGASRRVVQDWEAGVNVPGADRLQTLIVVLLEATGLTVGREVAEVRELWAAALRELSSRMHTPLDEIWLDRLLAQHLRAQHTPEPIHREIPPETVIRPSPVGAVERRQDWGEAPDVVGFVGRGKELGIFRSWVLDEGCRLLSVLGMGGIGKTTLAARLAQDIAPTFQRLYWRSLRDALPVSEWLAGAIAFLSEQQVTPPEGEARQIASLLHLLRERPALLVLDNFETVLEPGDREGGYRDSYGGYGRLLQAIGEGRHQSCLVLTSREAPPELSRLGGGAARTFELGGLGLSEGQALLVHNQLSGSSQDWANLIARFGGNGLALKVVGESIRQLFGGDIGAFLDGQEAGSGTVFGGIRRLLAEQIERSSPLEQDVMRILAVEREPVTLSQLIASLVPGAGRGAVLEAVEALRRRSLVERAETAGAAAYTLQSVVLEYVTDRLVEEVSDEIARGQPVQLVDKPLIKAQAKDYVRYSQERLIGELVLQRLQAKAGIDEAEQRLLQLIDRWRDRPPAEQGFGPGNVVNLLRLWRGDLRGLDLGHLTIRQAYFADVELQDASLAGAHLSEAVLAEAFNYPQSLALSRDGAFLMAGTVAGQVWLWRVADRTPLLAVEAHTGPVYSVALSADGRLLASGGEEGSIRIWDAPSGGLVASLRGHTGGVWGVALSGDGQFLASGGLDGTVRLWETMSGRPLGILEGHTGSVFGVALSADGRLLASGSQDGTVRLWESPTGKPLATFESHTGGVRGVALSADGRLLAAADWDGAVRLWEADLRNASAAAPSGWRLVATLPRHTAGVMGVALSVEGRLLATGSWDGNIQLWDATFATSGHGEQDEERAPGAKRSTAFPPNGARLSATLRAHTGGLLSVSMDQEGQLLASGALDGTIRLWDRRGGRLLTTLQGHRGGASRLALSSDKRLLGSPSFDGTIQLWDVSSGRPIVELHGHTGGVRGVAFSADGRLLASGGMDGSLRLWSLAGAAGESLRAILQAHTSGVGAVALSADGQLLASGGLDGHVQVWEASSGRLLASLEGHSGPVFGVALSADGQLLASGGLDGTVRLWDTQSRQQRAILRGHTSGVWDVALSTDGRLLASAGFDGTVRVWDTSAEQPIATLRGHTSAVYGVELSGNGQRLVSGSIDGTVRQWEVGAEHSILSLEGRASPVFGLALSSDGEILAGDTGGTVRLWNAHSGAHVRTLRSDRHYERLDITGLTGITPAQRAAVLSLGAVEHQE